MAYLNGINISQFNIATAKFLPEDAVKGEVIVAQSLTNSSNCWIVQHLQDIRNLGGYYAFKGEVNGIPRQFTREGLSDDGVYQLKTLQEVSTSGVTSRDTVISSMGASGSVAFSDEVIASSGAATENFSNTKTISKLNIIEEVALSSLNGLIQDVKDVEPWNINNVKVKLLVGKAFDFSYEFLTRALADRTYDPVTGGATDDPNNPDPGTGGNSGEPIEPTVNTAVLNTSSLAMYSVIPGSNSTLESRVLNPETVSSGGVITYVLHSDESKVETLSIATDDDTEWPIRAIFSNSNLIFDLSYGGQSHQDYLNATFSLKLFGDGEVSKETVAGESMYAISAPGGFFEIRVVSDKPIFQNGAYQKTLGTLAIGYPVEYEERQITYGDEDDPDAPEPEIIQVPIYEARNGEVHMVNITLLKQTTSNGSTVNNTPVSLDMKFIMKAVAAGGEATIIEQEN